MAQITSKQEHYDLEVVATPVTDPAEMNRDEAFTVDADEATVLGACAAGGLIGCLIGGPILACIAGGCGAYLTTRNNAAGDCARSLGRGAVSTKDKAMELGAKHRVTQRTQAAADSCWNSMKDANERHKISERTKSGLADTWEGMKHMNSKYRITERSLQAAGEACGYVGTQIEKALIEERSQRERDGAGAVPSAPGEQGQSRYPDGAKTNGPYFVVDTGLQK